MRCSLKAKIGIGIYKFPYEIGLLLVPRCDPEEGALLIKSLKKGICILKISYETGLLLVPRRDPVLGCIKKDIKFLDSGDLQDYSSFLVVIL